MSKVSYHDSWLHGPQCVHRKTDGYGSAENIEALTGSTNHVNLDGQLAVIIYSDSQWLHILDEQFFCETFVYSVT